MRKKGTGRGRKDQNKEGEGGKTEQRLKAEGKGYFCLSNSWISVLLILFFSLILCVGRSEVGKLHGEEGVNILVLPSRFPCLDGECNAWLKARDSGNGFTK